MSQIRNDNYLNIPGWMINCLDDLNDTELWFFAVIYGFSQDLESGFTGSIEYLRGWKKCSEKTVRRVLDALVEKGYITKESHQGVKNMTCKIVYAKVAEKVGQNDRGEESKVGQNVQAGRSKCPKPSEIQYDNTSKEVVSNDTTKKEPTKEEIQSVVDAWNQIGLPKIIKMTDERRKRIVALLNCYGLSQVLLGIQKVSRSGFCKGNGNNGWKANFDWFLNSKYFIRVLEGNYDDTDRSAPASASERKPSYDINKYKAEALADDLVYTKKVKAE